MSFISFASLALAVVPVDAPVAEVAVYSDQARVTRVARLNLQGAQTFEFPMLLDTIDASSIRVEAKNAFVRRVDIAPVDDDQLPVDEARQLLAELEKVDEQLLRVQGELDALSGQRAVLQRLQPQAPKGDALKPAPKLNPSGWSAALEFVGTQLSKVDAGLRERNESKRELTEQRALLADKARLLGGARRRNGWKVSAQVSGRGQAELALTYRVWQARWYPTYDLALDPSSNQVQVAFAGLVSQQTGEDWTEAKVVLSTAVPSTATVAPQLMSWKIGEQERFIPTPRPMPEQPVPAPVAVPLPPKTDEVQLLRSRLMEQAAQVVAGSLGGVSDSEPAEIRLSSDAFEQERELKPEVRFKERARSAPPPAAAPSMMAASAEDEGEEAIVTGRAPGVSAMALSLAPPPSYRARRFDPSLPASLAGGYDLAFHSLRAETIPSGKGARRVALLSETWPVRVERKVFPALAADAFLVAEIKSPSRQVLPGGSAQLFVGADPAGTARLKVVAPGESFTLPLGLDRALKPVRNVQLVQSEQGFIGKDEVNRYVVKIELANPYATAIPVRVIDQWPVSGDKDVEIRLLETKPVAIQDKVKGGLEWRITLPPSGKTELSFTYTIRRPKGWRLVQH